jgi:hypothetical protein
MGLKHGTTKGDLTLRALEVMGSIACGIGDLFFIFTLPYGTPLGKALRELEKRSAKREALAGPKYEKSLRRRQVYNLLYFLKKDGLIQEAGNHKFKITIKGRTKIKVLKRRLQQLPRKTYVGQSSTLWTIVIFDVPEKESYKRRWLRSTLKNMEFKMLQKSVWAGRTRVPKSLLDDMGALGMLDYVDIFAISKSGTLTQKL